MVGHREVDEVVVWKQSHEGASKKTYSPSLDAGIAKTTFPETCLPGRRYMRTIKLESWQ
jgi:hypothetical protein